MRSPRSSIAKQKRENEPSYAQTAGVLEYISDAFFSLDKNWRYTQINKKARVLAQKTKEEIIGKVWYEIFPEIKKTPFFKAAKTAMEKKTSATVEAYYPPLEKWYESNYYPIDNGIAVFSKDITNQKKLDEVEKYFSSIVANSDDAIISKNLNGIIKSWNPAAERMFGYTAKEVIGKPITIIIPKELYHEEKMILSNLKQGKRVDHFQTVRVTKKGERKRISLTVSPIKDEKGVIIGASKIARDVTDQIRAEENFQFLSEASKLLSSSLDYNTTLQGVARIAVPHIADWCAVDMLENNELHQLAVSHKDPKKVAWAKAYRKANPPKMTDKGGVAAVVRSGKSQLYPFISDQMLVATAKNKQQLDLIRGLHMTSVMIVPILSGNKTIGVISFIATDTRRNYNEIDLHMAEELASRASLAIQNAKLYEQAQKEIEQRKVLEKQKDDFLGIASHELKTPVTSIKAFAQVLRLRFEREGNSNAADLLGKLDAQVDKLTSLISDLLDVTKIESGKMQFNEDPFYFDDLVDELVEELQRTTEKHEIIQKGKTEKKIVGDKERIGQVLTNLVSNAIKYSPHSDKIIVDSSVEGNNIKVSVQDFGLGISEDKQNRVFERFFRVSGPGKETFPGLGLGLYISSQIIKRLGGRIWVESTEGKGSTFCFTLPIKAKKLKQDRDTAIEDIRIQHE